MDPDALWDEVAELAYGYKWSLDDILDLEHGVRRRFLGYLDRLRHGG